MWQFIKFGLYIAIKSRPESCSSGVYLLKWNDEDHQACDRISKMVEI